MRRTSVAQDPSETRTGWQNSDHLISNELLTLHVTHLEQVSQENHANVLEYSFSFGCNLIFHTVQYFFK